MNSEIIHLLMESLSSRWLWSSWCEEGLKQLQFLLQVRLHGFLNRHSAWDAYHSPPWLMLNIHPTYNADEHLTGFLLNHMMRIIGQFLYFFFFSRHRLKSIGDELLRVILNIHWAWSIIHIFRHLLNLHRLGSVVAIFLRYFFL